LQNVLEGKETEVWYTLLKEVLMDFIAIIKDLTSRISEFAQANPLIALGVLLILAYLIYRKPLFFFSVLILGLVLAGVLYLILSLSTPGVSQKEKLIKKGRVPENSFRSPGIML
jgi:hypothetical protein